MASPLLVVMMSATSVAVSGVAGLPGAADTTPDTAETAAPVECVLPTGESIGGTEPAGTTEAVETTEPVEQSPGDGFFEGFCRRAQEVAAVGPLLTGSPTRDNSEQFRVGLCDPEFVAPDRAQSTQNWVIYIRGTAQTDPQSGATWLEAGVLTSYEAGDNDATELNEDLLEQLVDIEIAFLDQFEEHRDEWCADLVEPVETTEA